MKEDLTKEGIQKEEKVSYLKSKMNLLQGTMYLTPERIALDARKTGVGGFGLLGALMKSKVESKSFGFNLKYNEINNIAQGKHGAEKNVLEITDKNNETYRVIVKNYEDWEKDIKAKM